MAFGKKRKFFYTRRDRHHFLARNRKYRQANVLRGIYAARGGPRIGLIFLLILIFLGLLILPVNYINDETKTVFVPIGTSPPHEDNENSAL